MLVPLHELRDVRVLNGKELSDRDAFAIAYVLQGVDRDGLRARMHEKGWRFSNQEYARWRKAAHEVLRDGS